MRKLCVLYDSSCEFCKRCRRWLEDQPKYLELEFLAADSAQIPRRFPELVGSMSPKALIVISNEGAVYRGAHAWIMCLYALEDYREWSCRLARPLLLPWAREFFELISSSRGTLSLWIRLLDDKALIDALFPRIPVAQAAEPAGPVELRSPREKRGPTSYAR